MIIKKMNVVLLGILLICVLVYVTGCDSVVQPIIQKYLLSLATNIDIAGTVTGGGSYSIGQKIQVSATVNEGYKFNNWTLDVNGIVVSNNASFEYIMPDSNVNLVANFSQQQQSDINTLTLEAEPEQGGDVIDHTDANPYEAGTTVDVEAKSNTGYDFLAWTIDELVVNTEERFDFDMLSEDTTLVAKFKLSGSGDQKYNLILQAEPEDGGIVWDNTANVEGGGEHSEKTVFEVEAIADGGYQFVEWTESETKISDSESFNYIMPESDLTLVAHFAPAFFLELVANPILSGKLSGEDYYIEGDEVTVSVEPDEGTRLVNWTDDNANVISTEESFIYTMPGLDVKLTANTEPVFNLTVTADPSEGGTATDNTNKSPYGVGEVVSLSASANSGYEFVNWTYIDWMDQEVVVSTEETFDYNMPDHDVDLIANFDVKPLTVKMTKVLGGTTTPDNGGVSINYDFEIGTYEVTNEEFCRFLNESGATVQTGQMHGQNYSMLNGLRLSNYELGYVRHNGTCFYVVGGFDDHPVMQTTHNGIFSYCNWLSEEKNMGPAYEYVENYSWRYVDGSTNNPQSTNSYRLPTIKEWLYAARGGKNGAATKYAGNDELAPIAWYRDNSNGPGNSATWVNGTWAYSAGQNLEPGDVTHGTMPVGKKTPNELGLYDMCGNIGEPSIGNEHESDDHDYFFDLDRAGGTYLSLSYDINFRFDLNNYNYSTSSQGDVGFRIARTDG